MYSRGGLSSTLIEDVLQSHPLEAAENIRVTELASATTLSHHIVQVRGAEKPYVHRAHDLTDFVHRGSGTMQVGDVEFDVKRGDIILVPREIPHAFSNRSRRPSVAIVVFTPAFDGKDTVPVSEKE
jgi:mannose-6-phosphate isomerase-like protein (cupin superfamily)